MLNLRSVKVEDCDLLFVWANDELVRKNSFNSDKIPYADHVKWFKEKIESSDSHIFILEEEGKQIGLIRLDKIKADSFIINYSIAKEYRGRGYATTLLGMIKEKFSSFLLVGKVKSANIGSIKAFINAGYVMEEEAELKIFYSFKKDNHQEAIW